MRRFLLKLSLFTPVMVLVAAINYLVDPAKLFSRSITMGSDTSYEESIATYNAAGYHVTNVESFDERLFQKYFILSSVKSKPGTLIMGTSRSQLIGHELFPDEVIINNSVTGATVEDLLGLLYLYDSVGYTPKTIILELAPWYLNEENGQSRWKTIEPEYNAFLENVIDSEGGATSPYEIASIDPKLLELLSFTYFQSSVQILIAEPGCSQNKELFSKSDFAAGYTVANFHRQLSQNLTNISSTPPDTIKWFNHIIESPVLFEDLMALKPEQSLPDEFISLHNEIAAQGNKKWDELSEVQKQRVYQLNRKLLELFFDETCPPSNSRMSFPTQLADNRGLTRKADGTISYPEDFRRRSVEQVSNDVQSFLSTPIFGLNDYKDLSGQKAELIGTTIEYLKRRNIVVVLLLVPYHPDVFRAMSTNQKYRNVFRAEEFYRKLAMENGIEIKGSYDPAACGLTKEEFYDAMHPKESAFTKIFNTLISVL